MENKKEENYIELEEEYPPPPPTAVTVRHKTVGGKGVVGRLGK
jgi:hypothetical protein